MHAHKEATKSNMRGTHAGESEAAQFEVGHRPLTMVREELMCLHPGRVHDIALRCAWVLVEVLRPLMRDVARRLAVLLQENMAHGDDAAG